VIRWTNLSSSNMAAVATYRGGPPGAFGRASVRDETACGTAATPTPRAIGCGAPQAITGAGDPRLHSAGAIQAAGPRMTVSAAVTACGKRLLRSRRGPGRLRPGDRTGSGRRAGDRTRSGRVEGPGGLPHPAGPRTAPTFHSRTIPPAASKWQRSSFRGCFGQVPEDRGEIFPAAEAVEVGVFEDVGGVAEAGGGGLPQRGDSPIGGAVGVGRR
jgi:hypothetical protein